ncbi:MAG: cytochrome c oxidase assembly protein [Candidatus Dormibacteraeota bacterium]|uniref:Cytochrome c oxidase assembly protein n=1 Tax=Candidatus Aeolococcus gillhamiae TaxID=3127015 RepID=A0A934K0Z8_9BACT|nr:cytochrome c oxidase assembly protein [Candidatus Dormibacteraeota bacterium]
MDVLRSLFGGWYAEPVPLIAAAVAVLLYDRGARRLAATAPERAPTAAQKAFLAAGVAVILVALLSPLDEGALRLQWVHMVQHVLLLVVAAPLMVLARPWETALEALGTHLRALLRKPQSVLTTHSRRTLASSAAVIMFVGVMWLWHIPALYNLTLRDEMVHNLEHTAFLAVGLLFWTAALPRASAEPALGMIGRSIVVLGGLVGSWLLAVYIGYAPAVLYAYPGGGTLSAGADQQLAAGVMWVPASIPFVAAIVWIMARWFENDARLAAAEAQAGAKVRA